MSAVTPGQSVTGCGCPAKDGKIYHQRGTCTDPVVDRLGWYADEPPAVTPGPPPRDHGQATPGQAALKLAFENWLGGEGYDEDGMFDVDEMEVAFEAGAEAERDLAAQQPQAASGDVLWVTPGDGTPIGGLMAHVGLKPQPAPGDVEAAFASGARVRTGPCTADAHDREHFQVRTNGHWLCGHLLASLLIAQGIVAQQPQPAPEAAEIAAERDRFRALLDAHLPLWEYYGTSAEPQPAPELAAAMAETRAALTDRDKYRNWLDDFTRIVLDVSDRAGLMRAAASLRRKAGFEP